MLSGPAGAATYKSTIFAQNLNNPRGLAFGPDGALYIAEGGTFNPGGPSIIQEGQPAEFGLSGSITRVENGVQTRIVTGLPSLTGITSGSSTGAADIAFLNGTGYFLIGLGADPAARTGALGSAPEAVDLGGLYSFSGNVVTKLADIAAFEALNNPAGGPIDSNPFKLTAGPGRLLVTDAGGNSLLSVTPEGVVSLEAVFPGRDIGGGFPSDSVPTGVAVGPDGAFYVGELTGFPFTPGQAQIFRIDADDGTRSVHATGFTNLTDIAWGADGFLYALQFADSGIPGGPPGSLVRLEADGSLTTIFGGLIAPVGLEIGADGAFYVTQFSASSGVGQVLRIAAVPEPASWAMLVLGFGVLGMAARRRRATFAQG
ncbi:ScyD/ScyE family protein [Sandaracinobacteroides sayramensis]|uniref:ScyD/ScyE family protein n=1 Tax=Sandaracinobacteroides sayramensis TaxID=2913411 RepID=UPI001EDB395D|nr:ScyD/ScyE family protein [Sandaracinobacteroides sayramensis]